MATSETIRGLTHRRRTYRKRTENFRAKLLDMVTFGVPERT